MSSNLFSKFKVFIHSVRVKEGTGSAVKKDETKNVEQKIRSMLGWSKPSSAQRLQQALASRE
jgi:hypothetical protein